MLIAQITDTHIRLPGRLAYRRVDTAAMLRTFVAELLKLDPKPDLIVHTGDLVDFGEDAEYAHLREILAPLQTEMTRVPRSCLSPRRRLPALCRVARTAADHRSRYARTGSRRRRTLH